MVHGSSSDSDGCGLQYSDGQRLSSARVLPLLAGVMVGGFVFTLTRERALLTQPPRIGNRFPPAPPGAEVNQVG